jgi:hypothetical protein
MLDVIDVKHSNTLEKPEVWLSVYSVSSIRKYFDMSSKMKIVYHIEDRGGKNYWTRVGVAFVNSDGSINVKLETLPIDGTLHIRDYVSREMTNKPEDIES